MNLETDRLAARKYIILPVTKAGATVTVAMIDPTNVFAMDDVNV